MYAVFESARMLLEAACEPRGVHFSASLSEAFTGCFLHPRSLIARGGRRSRFGCCREVYFCFIGGLKESVLTMMWRVKGKIIVDI